MHLYVFIIGLMIQSAHVFAGSVEAESDDEVAISVLADSCRGLIAQTLSIPAQGSNRVVCGVEVEVDIEHTYIGDLRIFLSGGGITQEIMTRDPQLIDEDTCDGQDMSVTFSDSAANPPIITANAGPASPACTGDTPVYDGEFRPYGALSIFDGINLSSATEWTLIVDDTHTKDCGSLEKWKLKVTTCASDSVRATGLPQPISVEAGQCKGLISNTLTIPAQGDQEICGLQVSVDITHTFIGDLRIYLSSQGTTRQLMFRNVQLIDEDTCDGQDMSVTFSDGALNPPIVTELAGPATPACSITIPMYEGEFQPYESLDVFEGISLCNDVDFTLIVDDTHTKDCGILNNWSIQYVKCSSSECDDAEEGDDDDDDDDDDDSSGSSS